MYFEIAWIGLKTSVFLEPMNFKIRFWEMTILVLSPCTENLLNWTTVLIWSSNLAIFIELYPMYARNDLHLSFAWPLIWSLCFVLSNIEWANEEEEQVFGAFILCYNEFSLVSQGKLHLWRGISLANLRRNMNVSLIKSFAIMQILLHTFLQSFF